MIISENTGSSKKTMWANGRIELLKLGPDGEGKGEVRCTKTEIGLSRG